MDSQAKVRSNRSQILSLYLLIILHVSFLFERSFWVVWSIKCAFKSVTIKNAKFSEKNHSCSRIFCGFIRKFTVLERKKFISLTKEVGN
jgi:hypothetical protein